MRLNSEILLFGNLVVPPIESVRASASRGPSSEPPASEKDLHSTESIIHRTMQKVERALRKQKGIEAHQQIHTDVLNNGKWFESQSLLFGYSSFYHLAVPFGDSHSNTHVWAAASLVIPAASLWKDGAAADAWGSVEGGCEQGYFVALAEQTYRELNSSFHSEIDFDLSPERWIHRTCVNPDKPRHLDSHPYLLEQTSTSIAVTGLRGAPYGRLVAVSYACAFAGVFLLWLLTLLALMDARSRDPLRGQGVLCIAQEESRVHGASRKDEEDWLWERDSKGRLKKTFDMPELISLEEAA